MGRLKIFAALILAAAVAGSAAIGQEIDLSGTWSGTTYISDRGVDDEMTLILRKEGDVYSGTVTDSIGLANEAELTSCEFKDNVLTVQFNVFDGQNTNAVRCVLRLEGEYLVGTWETDSGVLGEIKLERKA